MSQQSQSVFPSSELVIAVSKAMYGNGFKLDRKATTHLEQAISIAVVQTIREIATDMKRDPFPLNVARTSTPNLLFATRLLDKLGIRNGNSDLIMELVIPELRQLVAALDHPMRIDAEHDLVCDHQGDLIIAPKGYINRRSNRFGAWETART